MAVEDRKVSIEYCGTCNYRPMAASLAKTVETIAGVQATLIHSHTTGAFEVKMGTETIYSKMQSGQFPDNQKIAEVIRKRLI